MKSKLLSLVVVVALNSLASAGGVRTISVTGAGSVQAVPNVASVSFTFTKVGGLDSLIPNLITDNRANIDPSLAYIKDVVGKAGTVEVNTQSGRVLEYNDKTRKNEQTGFQTVTTIAVTLRGEGDLQGRLGKLYDSSKIKATETSEASFALSDRRQAASERQALRIALNNARGRAEAQLEPGEKLGKALSRGNQVSVPSPRPMMRAHAAAESVDGGSAGQAVVEMGKIAVRQATSVLFAVSGTARRLVAGK